ncbi:hypothetical protein [Microcystis phage Mwe-JY08]
MQIEVSDHALIRWLERGHNIPMEWFRREMERDVARGAEIGCSLVGEGKFEIRREHIIYVVRAGRVLTVLRKGRGE